MSASVTELKACDLRGGRPVDVRATARQMGRAVAILFFSLCALAECACIAPFHRREKRLRARAAWLHRWCRVACHLLGLKLETRGFIPRAGMLVSNHLSYLDIIAMSALQPCVFVAKSEVAGWPLFGWLARSAGTVFVERTRMRDCPRALAQMRAALESNLLVVLFPEGTSSDGSRVLPFKSALLEAAVRVRRPITPAGLRYFLEEGRAADEVCYWGEATLVPHILNLLRKREISASITFSPAQSAEGNRKAVALKLHAAVSDSLG